MTANDLSGMTPLERAQWRYQQAEREATEISRLAAVAGRVDAFKATPEARATWARWAVERFRLATEQEINHLCQFSTYDVLESGDFVCTGMTPSGWARLIEFTDRARKEGRKITGYNRPENNSEIKQENDLTIESASGILKVSGEQVA